MGGNIAAGKNKKKKKFFNWKFKLMTIIVIESSFLPTYSFFFFSLAKKIKFLEEGRKTDEVSCQ